MESRLRGLKPTETNAKLALWIGVECTINRVGELFSDQCRRNGHDRRLSDLERFAEIKAERIRYPCLWEKAAPRRDGEYDWRLFDARLAELRRLELQPIVGLLHHGSGPRFTSLLDPAFPRRFAGYARAFAERYPWVEDYTPINEPLTTARFSGLYGVWYPHERGDPPFARALLNQIEATKLAMGEIRRVQPAARLIQTEDLGRASSTPRLRYQADFENERRWLSFDLLAGAVDEEHPLWGFLTRAGLHSYELDRLRDEPCRPDVLGINHYLLSNRFLDHRLERYPACLHGGNGMDRYADLGAVDCEAARNPPPESVLWEAWKRYRRPLAVTETHLGGPREAQMRWLHEIWSAASSLRAQGADMRAVTAWSLLGTFDWNSLCARESGYYESGLFDVRAPEPRQTKLVEMARGLAADGGYEHVLLRDPGWWKTPRRIIYPAHVSRVRARPTRSVPLLITGGSGTLGRALARVCEARGVAYRLLTRDVLDITQPRLVRRILGELKPWAVVNAAGFVDVDRAEVEPERCHRSNVHGPMLLAEACLERKIPFMTFSSDLVFGGEGERDGGRQEPYLESDEVAPLNIYGQTKAEAERRVGEVNPDSLIVRTSSFFGPWDTSNFVTRTLRCLRKGEPVVAAADVRVSPTYVPDLAHVCLDLLIDGEKGILHLTNEGEMSWSELANLTLALGRDRALIGESVDPALLEARPLEDMPWLAPRPRYSALSSERLKILPPLESALERYFSQVDPQELFSPAALRREKFA